MKKTKKLWKKLLLPLRNVAKNKRKNCFLFKGEITQTISEDYYESYYWIYSISHVWQYQLAIHHKANKKCTLPSSAVFIKWNEKYFFCVALVLLEFDSYVIAKFGGGGPRTKMKIWSQKTNYFRSTHYVIYSNFALIPGQNVLVLGLKRTNFL